MLSKCDVFYGNDDQRTPLSLIAEAEDGSENVRLLLERMSDVSSQDNRGRTPLIWACSSGSDSSVSLLLKSNSNIWQTDVDGPTALHAAVKRDHSLPIVKSLLDQMPEASEKKRFLGCLDSQRNTAIALLITNPTDEGLLPTSTKQGGIRLRSPRREDPTDGAPESTSTED